MPSELYLRGPVASLEIWHNHHDAHIGSYDFLPLEKLYQDILYLSTRLSRQKLPIEKSCL